MIAPEKKLLKGQEKELKELAESNPRIILVANKIDLPDKEISSEEGNQLAKEYNSNFFEISALTGVGVDNIFENITNEIYNYKMELRKETEEEEKNINDVNPNKKKLVISFGNERYEKRNNESGSCACWNTFLIQIVFFINYIKIDK